MIIKKIDLKESFTSSPIVYDINSDGIKEIIVLSESIFVIDPLNFKFINPFPLKISGPVASTPYITKKDESIFLYFGSDNKNFYTLRIKNNIIDYKFLKTGGDIFSSPLIYDIDKDGIEEIIFGSDDFYLYIIKSEKIFRYKTLGFISSSPSLFKLNGKNFFVFCSWDNFLYLGYFDGNNIELKFKKDLSFYIWASPVIDDINFDGKNEIIVTNNSLHVLDFTGNYLKNFPYRFKSFTISSPCIADIDGDNFKEIIVISDALYVFNIRGEILEFFPFKIKSPSISSPCTLDFDNDEYEEIVIFDYEGNYYVVNREGKRLFKPVKLSNSFVATPYIEDLDGDGLLEIVNVSFDGKLFVIKTEGKKSSFKRFRGNYGNGFLGNEDKD
ncbi:MAG: VCBS repeat-containing protein [candidate division WOR-3 bacterium]